MEPVRQHYKMATGKGIQPPPKGKSVGAAKGGYMKGGKKGGPSKGCAGSLKQW